MKKSLLFLFATLAFFTGFSQTNTYSGSGSWNTAANWSLTHIPTAAEDAVIPLGASVTSMSSGAVNVCKTLTVAGTLTFSGGTPRFITVSGNVSITGTMNMTGSNQYYIDYNGSSFSVGAAATMTITTTNAEGGLRYTGAGASTFTNSSASSFGSILVSGAGALTTGSNSTLTKAITVSNAAGSFNIASGNTITSTGGATTVSASGGKINVTGTWINQSATAMSLTGAGAVTLNSGGTYVNQNAAALSTPLNSFAIDNASTFIYRATAGTAPTMSISGRTYGNLTFDNTSGTWSTLGGASGAGTCTVNGTLSIGGSSAGAVNTSSLAFTGTFDVNGSGGVSISTGSTFDLATTSNAIITNAGNWSNSGTFTQGTGLVTFDGTGTQTITRSGGETFKNLTINKASGKVALGGAVTISTGTLTLTSGYIELGNFDFTLNPANAVAGTPAAGKCLVTNGTGLVKAAYATSAYTFPVGTATKYAPVRVTNSGASQTYSVGVVSPTTYSTSADAANFDWTVNCSGSVSSDIDFYWASADAGANLLGNESAGVVFQGGALSGSGGTTTSGTPNVSTITGVTSFTGPWQVVLNTNPYFSATALTSFGNQLINGTYGPNTFTLSGGNLTSANVTLAALPGFSYSTDGGVTYTAFNASNTFTQPGGSLSKLIYVKFNPTAIQSYNGNIVITGAGVATAKNVAAVGSGVASNTSTLVPDGTYSYTSNINYTLYTAASSLTTGNSIGVMGLTMADLGGDGIGTTLTGLTFTVPANTGNAIKAAALFVGGSNVSELTTVSGTSIAFSGLSISAAESGTQTFELRVTFENAVVEHQMTYTIGAVTAGAATSNFTGGGATGVSSTATAATNKLSVTATTLSFTTQPPAVGNVSVNLSTAPIVSAVDANGNVDIDFSYTGVSVTNSAGLTMSNAPTVANAANGILTFPSNFQFTTAGGPTTITVTVTPYSATSSSITIYAAPVIYDFTTAAPTSGTPVTNVTFSNVTSGNSFGATTLLSATSPSSGYTGATGTNNAGVASYAVTGTNSALNVSNYITTTNPSNAYFEFTLTPAAGYTVTLGSISFGSRSTATGPQNYVIRSNKDCFSANIASGTMANTSTWTLFSPTITPVVSFAGTPITFRIYGYGGIGAAAASSVNWRIDDLTINVLATSVATPYMATSLSYMPDFGTTAVGVPNLQQSFSLSGDNLTGFSSNITVTAPTDFEVSNDGITWGSTTTIPYTSATLAAATVNVRINPQSLGIKTGCVTFSGAGVAANFLPEVWVTGYCNSGTYYSKSTGDLNTLATWGTNTDGSGIAPLDFTSNSQTFYVRNNANATITAPWTVSGTSSKVIVGNGSSPITFTIPAAFAMTGTVDVLSNGTLDITNTTLPTIGSLLFNSTVNYSGTSQTISAINYSNLSLIGATTPIFTTTVGIGRAFNPGSITGATVGAFTFNGTAAQTLPTFDFFKLTINNAAGVSVPVGVNTSIASTAAANAFTITSGVVTVNGTLTNNSTASVWSGVNATSLLFSSTGNFYLAGTGGTIPTAGWGTGSTCYVTGINTTTAPTGRGQTFYNYIWDCPNQAAGKMNYNGATQTNVAAGGVFWVKNTGASGQLQLCGTTGTSFPLSGSYKQTGGLVSIWSASSGNRTMTVNENIDISGGTLIITELTGTGTGTLTAKGNVTVSSTGSISQSATAASLVFGGTASQTITGLYGTGTSGDIDMTLNNAAGAVLGSDLTESGIFTLTSGALTVGSNTLTFHTSNTPIVATSGTITTTSSSNLVFGTPAKQAGSAFTIPNTAFTSAPPVVGNLTVDRTNPLSLGSQGMSVSTVLTLSTGELAINGSTLTINGTISGTGTGTLTGSSSSNLVIGGATGGSVGTLNLTSGARSLNDFTINRTGATPSATMGTDIRSYGTATFTSGALIIGSNTLEINNGSWGSGTVTGSSTSNLTVDGNGGSMKFTGGVTTMKNLLLNASALATLGDNLEITAGAAPNSAGSVEVKSSAILTTGGKLVLKSGVYGTAYVKPIPVDGSGNPLGTISGNVVVERYYQAHRAWRCVAAPANSASTIQSLWQEGGEVVNIGDYSNPNPGYGTHITGPAGTYTPGLGFDHNVQNNPSLRYWDGSTQKWENIPNTNSTLLNAHNTYMLFVRGSRDNNLPGGTGAVTDPTVIRTIGTLNQGDQATIAGSGAGTVVAVNNPYASAINFRNVTKSGLAGVDAYKIWDPLLGGSNQVGQWIDVYYDPTDPTGPYDSNIPAASPIDLTTGRIESGASVMVIVDGGGSSSVQVKEADKDGGSALVFRPSRRPMAPGIKHDYARVYLKSKNSDATETIVDGVNLSYNPSFSNDIDNLDIPKFSGFSENLSIKSHNMLLSVERRHMINTHDTIFLNIANMRAKNYAFQIILDRLNSHYTAAYVEDTLLHTKTQINLQDTSVFNFNIAAGTAPAGRFRILLRGQVALPVAAISSVKATQQNTGIAVEWKVDNELNIKNYVVEKSTDGIHFTTAVTIPANASSIYNWLDVDPKDGNNYYRIYSVNQSGESIYSQVVKVTVGKLAPSLNVYSTIITNGSIGLQFNNMPKGIYHVKLMNAVGQVFLTKQIAHEGGSAVENIAINKLPVKGMYHLEVIKPDNTKTSLKVVNQ